MTRKPKPKTTYSRRVVVYDIATGNRSEFPSISKAAEKLGGCVSYLGTVIRTSMLYKFNVCAYIEDEKEAIRKLRSYKDKGEFVKNPKQEKEGLVPLRIDKKTVIYVTRDKANKDYAEQWRMNHEAKTNRGTPDAVIKMNNGLSKGKKKTGGRK